MENKKEYNLSERIEQLRIDLKNNAKFTEGQIDGIMRMILFMDREFIKRLKGRNESQRKWLVEYEKLNKQELLKLIADTLDSFDKDIEEFAGEALVI